MNLTPDGQYVTEMPDGLIVERLPLGYAHSRWRLSFITSGSKAIWNYRERGIQMADAFRDRIGVEGVGGQIEVAGSGCGGGAKEQEYRLAFRVGESSSGVRIMYRFNGQVVDDEVVTWPNRRTE